MSLSDVKSVLVKGATLASQESKPGYDKRGVGLMSTIRIKEGEAKKTNREQATEV